MSIIYKGHALDVLKTLPSESVQMCATSPPYYGLRDYKCPPATFGDGWTGQLGHESTPDLFVAHLVEIFAEVRRVLTPSGVLFVNMGDSYNGSGGAGGDYAAGGIREGQPKYKGRKLGGLKPKDLIGVPWMLAFALRADGWYLRSEIIWAKGVSFCPTYSGSCMPESVTDRPTSAHEKVFLLSKGQTYFYDCDAVREPRADARGGDPGAAQTKYSGTVSSGAQRYSGETKPKTSGRNLRNVWTINPKAYRGAHFAVWPPKLVEPMIQAGSSERGCCPVCLAPWERVVEKRRDLEPGRQTKGLGSTFNDACLSSRKARDGAEAVSGLHSLSTITTTGWRPTCDHDAAPIPCTVLDPFCGSGTTGIVAVRHRREFIGIDINGGDVDLGGHTAVDRIDAAELGQDLAEHQAGQTSLFSVLEHRHGDEG